MSNLVRRIGSLAKRVTPGLLLLVFGVAVSALLMEGGVRMLASVSDFFWEPDPVVGAKLIPNMKGRFVREGLFDVTVYTNSAGFHDGEHALGKQAGKKRILLLGNSTIEALQVPFDQSITAALERQLAGAGIPAETINLAVSGFGTGREYLMLREYGVRYEPDLVLLFFVGNDLLHNSRQLEEIKYLPYPIPDGKGVARDGNGKPRFTQFTPERRSTGLVGSFKAHSKAYQFTRRTLRESPALHAVLYRWGLMSDPPAEGATEANDFGMFEMYRPQYRAGWEEAWHLTRDLLLETKALAEQHGARFAVVLVPFPWEVDPAEWQDALATTPAMKGAELELGKPARLAKSVLEEHGILYVDLFPVFRETAARQSKLFFPIDHHWTPDGHRLAAEVVARAVAPMLQAK